MAVQQVLEGAAQAVRSAFGEGTEVYAGRVEQGAQPPCVFLEAQEAARRPLPCGRVELTVRVSAVYLAQSAAQGEDAPRLGLERLLEALAVVQTDGGPALGAGRTERPARRQPTPPRPRNKRTCRRWRRCRWRSAHRRRREKRRNETWHMAEEPLPRRTRSCRERI